MARRYPLTALRSALGWRSGAFLAFLLLGMGTGTAAAGSGHPDFMRLPFATLRLVMETPPASFPALARQLGLGVQEVGMEDRSAGTAERCYARQADAEFKLCQATERLESGSPEPRVRMAFLLANDRTTDILEYENILAGADCRNGKREEIWGGVSLECDLPVGRLTLQKRSYEGGTGYQIYLERR